MDKSSRPEVFYRKDTLENLAKSKRKTSVHSLFFNKVAGLTTCNFILKDTLAQAFYYDFSETFQTTIFYGITAVAACWWIASETTVNGFQFIHELSYSLRLHFLNIARLMESEIRNQTQITDSKQIFLKCLKLLKPILLKAWELKTFLLYHKLFFLK